MNSGIIQSPSDYRVFQSCKRLNLWKLFLGIRMRSNVTEGTAMKIQAAVRTIFLTIIGMAMISSARADSLTLASVGTSANPGQTNSSGATLPIAKNVDWAPALRGSSWVSFAQTGDQNNSQFTVVPIGTVVSFFDVFNLDQPTIGGTLRIMSDDSTTVILNGAAICAEKLPRGDNDATCSEIEIGFERAVSIHIPRNLLHLGANTLEFRVTQQRGNSFGLDYVGTVSFVGPPYQGYALPYGTSGGSPISVPEPSSLAMFAAGIVILAALALLITKKAAG
jgi:hypothetical protein